MRADYGSAPPPQSPQPADSLKNSPEQLTRHGNLGHLKDDVPGGGDHLGPNCVKTIGSRFYRVSMRTTKGECLRKISTAVRRPLGTTAMENFRTNLARRRMSVAAEIFVPKRMP